ncbi:hypothetical protein BJX63DRAFT_427642 [Aspergillus granulosus]|uniref:Uncharacterized protein n=1 Tax=Aspergillus granulosus TaxID=176169 RepID=A0ABR4I1M1_9EURO
MPPPLVRNIIGEELSGYILLADLEVRLYNIFNRRIIVRYHDGMYIFDAPGVVSDGQIS